MAAKRSSVISFLIKGDSKELSKSLDDAEGRLSKFGNAAGIAAKAVAAGLATIGAVSVREFMKFDAAMQQSVAIMGDVSDALRKDMSDAAREVAKTTTFSAEQAAESYFFLASAGLDAAASIAAMPKVAAFAQAGMFDMALATDLLTDAQSALGLVIRDDAVANMEQMVRLSDVLVKANTLANASVEQFSTALTTKAGGALRSMNIDLEEGVAVLAAFADQGIKGELAGTQLSIVLRDLTTKAIQNKGDFAAFGLEVFNAEGNINNLADIIGQLESGLDGMSDELQKATLLQLGFSDKSLGSLQALMGTSEQIRGFESALRDAGGVTDDIANKQLQTFSAQLGLLKSLFQDVAIQIGSVLVPVLGGLVSFIQGKGPQISAFAERAGEKIGAFITFVGDRAQEFRTFFNERLREPLEAIGTAIGTFVDAAKTKLSEFGGAIPGAVKGFTDFVAEVRGLADDPFALGRRLGDALVTAFVVALDEVQTLSGSLGAAFMQLINDVDWFSIGRKAITALIVFGLGFTAAFLGFEWFDSVFDAIVNNLPVIFMAALGFAFLPVKITSKVAQILGRIPLLGRFLAWFGQTFIRLGENIRAGASLLFETFGVSFRNAIAKLGPGIISRFVTFIRGIPQAFQNAMSDKILNVAPSFARFGTAVGNAVVKLVTKLREFLAFLFRPFKDFGKTLADDLFNIGKNVINALIRGIGSMAGVLRDAVSNIGRQVFNTLSNLWKIKSPSKVFMGIGKDAMQGLALGLAGSERMLRDLSTGVGNAALPSIDVAGAGSLGGQTVINVTVTAADPQAVVEALRRYVRANGPLGQVVSV